MMQIFGRFEKDTLTGLKNDICNKVVGNLCLNQAWFMVMDDEVCRPSYIEYELNNCYDQADLLETEQECHQRCNNSSSVLCRPVAVSKT